MMYPYITLSDETEITHSQIIEDGDVQKVEVHFELPAEHGFDSARCVLPAYQWKFNEGFSDAEIAFFKEFLQHNAHLLYRYSAQGGIHCVLSISSRRISDFLLAGLMKFFPSCKFLCIPV